MQNKNASVIILIGLILLLPIGIYFFWNSSSLLQFIKNSFNNALSTETNDDLPFTITIESQIDSLKIQPDSINVPVLKNVLEQLGIYPLQNVSFIQQDILPFGQKTINIKKNSYIAKVVQCIR